jgi:ribosome-binding protein aMBF1 (putative translation factor)
MTEVRHDIDNPEATAVSPVGNAARVARSRRTARNPEYARLWTEYAVAREIAQQLIKYRMATGFTQEELARRAGTSHSQISRLESGQHHSSISTLEKIAEALDLELSVTFTPRQATRVVAD